MGETCNAGWNDNGEGYILLLWAAARSEGLFRSDGHRIGPASTTRLVCNLTIRRFQKRGNAAG
jgi:hypothetical protein